MVACQGYCTCGGVWQHFITDVRQESFNPFKLLKISRRSNCLDKGFCRIQPDPPAQNSAYRVVFAELDALLAYILVWLECEASHQWIYGHAKTICQKPGFNSGRGPLKEEIFCGSGASNNYSRV
jgi:hypothetical protein